VAVSTELGMCIHAACKLMLETVLTTWENLANVTKHRTLKILEHQIHALVAFRRISSVGGFGAVAYETEIDLF
jgi:hypothetical protein